MMRTRIIQGLTVAVVVTALVLILNLLLGSGPLSDRQLMTVHLECLKCGHDFQMMSYEIDEQHTKADGSHIYDHIHNAHCPECKAQWGGKFSHQCPHCKEWMHPVPPAEGNGECSCPDCNQKLKNIHYSSKKSQDPQLDPQLEPMPDPTHLNRQ